MVKGTQPADHEDGGTAVQSSAGGGQADAEETTMEGQVSSRKGEADERRIVYALIEMHLPEFQLGYASGRKERVQGGEGLTDLDLLANLRVLVEEGAFLPENEELLQWHIGRCVGQMDVRPREEMMHIALDILRRASQVLSTAEMKLEELRHITMELLRIEGQREQRGR